VVVAVLGQIPESAGGFDLAGDLHASARGEVLELRDEASVSLRREMGNFSHRREAIGSAARFRLARVSFGPPGARYGVAMAHGLLVRARRALVIATAAALLAGSFVALPAFASSRPLAGIVPPKNPPKNLAPNPDFYDFCAPDAYDDTVACNSRVLLAIDHARATEPLGPLHFKLQKFLRLSVPEQLFAIANMERVSRGEPPVAALTVQLDEVAETGAVAARDPELSGAPLLGGAEMRAWGSNWADGTESALGADDGWMYDDGYGSSNYDCRSTHAAGCWGHRDNVLRAWSSYLAGCAPADQHLVMGAAYAKAPRYATSFAEIFVAACGPKPSGEAFTWAQAQAAIGI
jgi:hypothetical protein